MSRCTSVDGGKAGGQRDEGEKKKTEEHTVGVSVTKLTAAE